jgi:hypothetical protein
MRKPHPQISHFIFIWWLPHLRKMCIELRAYTDTPYHDRLAKRTWMANCGSEPLATHRYERVSQSLASKKFNDGV